MRVHSRVPVVVRDGEARQGADGDEHRHPQHNRQPDPVSRHRGLQTLQAVQIEVQPPSQVPRTGLYLLNSYI